MPQCANFEKDILARKVGLLYSHLPGGAAVNLSVSLGIFLMFMPTMPGLKLYLWFAGSAAVVFLRIADYMRYRHSRVEGISDARAWCLRFAAGSTAQGILWGVAGFFLFPSSNLSHQFMLTIILCGMAGGAIIFLSPVYFVYLLYLLPTLLPASIRILVQAGDGYLIVGMLGPVYLFGMSYASWRTSRWLDTSLRLVVEKETIAVALKKAHEQLELRVSERTADLKTANENLKQEMEKKNQAEYALTTEKERLSVTLRSIAEGVVTTDVDGRIIFLNKVAEDLTEWRQKDAAGRDLSEIFHIINTLTMKRWEDPFSLIFRSEQINGPSDHTMLIGKNGAQRHISISGAPITDKADKRIGVVLVFRDMTEKIKMEEELLKIKKLESLGVLAGGIAHDFNNILTAILGNINLFLHTVELEESTRRLLSQAERAAIRATDLTKQLLTFSKGGEPVKETASLAEVIRESANFVLRGSKAVCRFSIPDDLWLVNIDKGQIGQVIQNIVLNASQAMPDGGVVEVTCENEEKDQKHVKITVKDSGIGIPANEIDRIFDPYFSTKREGSGLGLAITYSIIKKHGGRISVQSEPGAGTIFTIYLPLSEDKLENPEHEENVAYCPKKARILVMDDDTMVRDIAASMLTKLGHTVIHAQDGAEALQLYEESANPDASIDLIIMDLTVPGGMGGQEAAKKILAINSEARIIASSGYSNDPIIANFRNYGFCSAIVKPYSFQGLKEVVNGVLGKI